MKLSFILGLTFFFGHNFVSMYNLFYTSPKRLPSPILRTQTFTEVPLTVKTASHEEKQKEIPNIEAELDKLAKENKENSESVNKTVKSEDENLDWHVKFINHSTPTRKSAGKRKSPENKFRASIAMVDDAIKKLTAAIAEVDKKLKTVPRKEAKLLQILKVFDDEGKLYGIEPPGMEDRMNYEDEDLKVLKRLPKFKKIDFQQDAFLKSLNDFEY